MRRLFSLCVIASLLLPLTTIADQLDERLDDLFQQLKHAENQSQAFPIENNIWRIWMEHDNAQFETMMQRGIAQMNANNLQASLATFNRLIEQAPEYAEAWNKRATINYLLGDYEASEADIKATLRLEPYHFGALSGQGLIYLQQREYFRARNSFNAVLEIYPTMDGANANLQALEQMLRNSAI